MNDDETEAVVYEEFVNPAARLDHRANLGDNVAGMLAIVDLTAEVWSRSNPALRASTNGYDVKFYKPLLRFGEQS